MNIGSTHAMQGRLMEKKLYGEAGIVRLQSNDPHPGPAEVADQAGQGSDLEGIAGHGAHEHGKLCLLTQAAAGGKVAHLVEGQTEDYFSIKSFPVVFQMMNDLFQMMNDLNMTYISHI